MTTSVHFPLCNRCGHPLTDRYIQALGGVWHPDCWLCEACGKPIKRNFVEDGNHAYHTRCYEERYGLHCCLCSALIQGEYFLHEGKPVCKKDFLAKIAPHCGICGEVLTGTYLENTWGQKVCSVHRDEPRCTSCERWLNLGERVKGTFASFGTQLCHHCKPRAIRDKELGLYNNDFGAAALAQMGLSLRELPQVPLRLGSANQIQTLHGGAPYKVEGVTETVVETINGRESARLVQGIAIIGGLAQEHFEGVLAHEFGHVWLFQEHLDHPRGSLIAEGFCELVRMVWLAKLGTPLAKAHQEKLAANQDPIYGDGLRLFQSRWSTHGLRGILDLVVNS